MVFHRTTRFPRVCPGPAPSGSKEGVEDAPIWRCRAEVVAPGRTATFQLACGGRALRGFVVNHAGRHHAYENRCPHAGTPLDLWPNEVLSEDGRLLVCATHGAVFAPDTGVCLEGPCPGARLLPLPLRLDGEWLVVTCPS
jgi:nitrite reductase/ring-hydroxylating ferredoxin subunit